MLLKGSDGNDKAKLPTALESFSPAASLWLNFNPKLLFENLQLYATLQQSFSHSHSKLPRLSALCNKFIN